MHGHVARASFDAEKKNVVVGILELGRGERSSPAVLGAEFDALGHRRLAVIIGGLDRRGESQEARGDKSRTASAKNDARVKNRFQMNLGGPGRCEDREAKP